ncbi:MAG: hypothetical protein GY773_18070 [Actinomycetia bacterium]|nr:hypothetical protein [Actinomycetes bacterium]
MAQLWWSSTGHAIIVTRQADGLFRVRDSNTTRGYQDELVEAWGYSGADVGVAPIRA